MTREGLVLAAFATACPAILAAAAGLSFPWVCAGAFTGLVSFACGVIAMGPYGR